MREWRLMLGPFLIWTAHFLLVYGVASVADLSGSGGPTTWRTVGLALSAAAGAGMVAAGLWARSRSGASPLARRLGVVGSVVGLIAVIWQSLPLVISA